MFPILFKFSNWIPLIGGHALHTYGLMAALGFLSGLLWVRHEARRLQISEEKVLDLFFYIILATIVGARLLYIFISVPEWWSDPLVFFRIWEGGLVFYGGLISSVVVSLWYCRKHRLPFLTVADIFMPGLALGHAIGRLGCFAAGCCYGKPVPLGSFWGVMFPDNPDSVAPHEAAIYPTQLFEAAGLFILFLILFLFRKKKKFEGEVFLVYLILYPLLRIIMEMFRGDAIRGFVVEGLFSTSQFISVLWMVTAFLLWATISQKRKTR